MPDGSRSDCWPGNHLLEGMRYGTGLVLLGALRGGSARTVEQRVIEAQQRLTAAEKADTTALGARRVSKEA